MATAPHEAFKMNLNQNLWGLVVGFIGLGLGERYCLHTLYWCSLALSVVMLLSLVFTTPAYTINYWRNKMKQDRA